MAFRVFCLFGALLGALAEVPVTLRVGMAREVTSSAGVYVAGSFQGWEANATRLLDLEGNGVYQVMLNLSAGFHEFKFINSNTWENAEEVPFGCSEQQSGHFNRYISIPEGASSMDYHTCFSACEPCDEIPPCKLFTCPSWMLHRPEALELIASSAEECCVDGSADLMDVVVQSAGFSDGNEVSFWLNGKQLHSSSARGLTILVLAVDGEVVGAPKTFDTNQDSTEVEIFLQSLASNTTVLVGVSDEASSGLTDRGRALIQACGGQQIGRLQFRDSYALIGVKDGSAYAEAYVPRDQGKAVAVSALPRVELPMQGNEPCNALAPVPPTRGKLHSTGNLEMYTDSGKCRYAVFEPESIDGCLGGSWVVVMGTSNAQLMANSLLFILAQEDAIPYIDFGSYNFLDFVLEDGQVSYFNAVNYSVKTCSQNTTGLNDQEQRCKEIYASELAKAPHPTSRKVRVTMAITFFWERARSIIDIVEADVAWKEAKVGYVAQVVAWYLVCQNIKFYLCPRKELKSDTEDETFAKFKSEMESVLDYMETTCAPSGRAGRGFGCVVATNSFTETTGPLLSAFTRFNQQVLESMAPHATPTFRALDVFEVGASMPRETIAGHGSQVLHLWVWTMIFGGWCPAEYQADSWMVSFQGVLCWAGNAEPSLCPRISYGNDWHCINSIPCVMKPVQAIETTPTPDKILVTFKVGMQDQTVSPAGVHVAGSFQDWDPAATKLLDSDQDGVHELTLALLPGFYEFKFINGDSWDNVEYVPLECQEAGSGHSNRFLSVESGSFGTTVHVCFAGCAPCAPKPQTTTMQPSTVTATSQIHGTTVTLTATGVSTIPEHHFVPVDGGVGRACRGSSNTDNRAEHYAVYSDANLSDCKARCELTRGCVGVEYSTDRCEVWNRSGGIQASINLTGFVCLGYVMRTMTTMTTTTTSLVLLEVFEEVDGGSGRACRGSNAGDNLASYYTVVSTPSLIACQEECLALALVCVGLEYSLGRCELWNRSEGIDTSIPLAGFTCLRRREVQSATPSRRLAHVAFLARTNP